ncbi:hypothetical protein [Burkholderia gladioli]|uniref:hypothetical protein n=1 Tax=Burkholderia gladioli TaxID=28095 RepID=UPI00163E33ED|nr:hypothetical protein [Burkholderia gladioli]
MSDVAVLFARQDSIYKKLPGCDVWDIERDARRYGGTSPVVAHPPCRAWGRLRHFAKPRPDEKALALFAVERVRQLGGVLEHPAHSLLWAAAGLPAPGQRDEFGGYTLPVHQHWWGHRAEKATWLYIVGCEPADLPEIPLVLGKAQFVVGTSGRRRDGTRSGLKREIKKSEREATPIDFARWLVAVAKKSRRDNLI